MVLAREESVDDALVGAVRAVRRGIRCEHGLLIERRRQTGEVERDAAQEERTPLRRREFERDTVPASHAREECVDRMRVRGQRTTAIEHRALGWTKRPVFVDGRVRLDRLVTDRNSRPRSLQNPEATRASDGCSECPNRSNAAGKQNPSPLTVDGCAHEVNISPGPGVFRAERDRMTLCLNAPGPGEMLSETPLTAARDRRGDPG